MSQPKTRLALTWLHCLETGIHCQYQWVLGSSSYFAWELFASPRHCRQPFERFISRLQVSFWRTNPPSTSLFSPNWVMAAGKAGAFHPMMLRLHLQYSSSNIQVLSSTGASLLLAYYTPMATAWFDNLQFMLDFRFCKTMSRTTVCGMFSHITRADQNHPVVESNRRKHNIRHVKKESSNLMKIGRGTKMNARILGTWANWNHHSCNLLKALSRHTQGPFGTLGP